MSNTLTRFFKEPLIQFLIIGAGIYGAYAIFGTPQEDYRDTIIRVDSNRIAAMISQWESRWNRPPTRQEIDGLIQAYIREDVLYRQAVAMGLNEDDPITRRRMAQKLEFLTSDLAQMQQPKEGELEGYFEENRESYRDPDLISFTHLFIDPDKRGDATLGDAADLLVQVQAAGAPDAGTLEAGDRFMLQAHYEAVTAQDIARQMGSGFAEAVMVLEAGKWHGPVLSGYGVHLVYIHDFQAAPPAELVNVRERVLDDWHTEMRSKFNADFLEGLKSRYEILIDELPADRLLDGQVKPLTEDDAQVETATNTSS